MSSRTSQYLIASRLVPGFAPAPLDQVEKRLREMPEVEVVKVITPRAAPAESATRRVIVARMPGQTAQMLLQAAGPQLVIERDHLLNVSAETIPLCADPGLAIMTPEAEEEALTATISVVGNKNTPVPRAQVYVFGSQWPARAITDEGGTAEVSLPGESAETITGVFVRPESDYWSQWIPEPDISPDGEITVSLTPLSETVPNYPKTRYLDWGLRAMQVDQLPPQFRGQGIKIGLIDSGVAAEHDSLKHAVRNGIDVTTEEGDGWKEDTVGHGTFCAGIIAARDEAGKGTRGCAPDAELVVCKVYPRGRYSDLLQALDYCIEQQVDIIQLGLSGPELSELVEERLIQARLLGITCIVAAGDCSRPVRGLAASPNVLAVAAVGKIGEFPANSYEAQTVTPIITPEGYFAARFSSFGPQVGLCAPGVAVISSTAPNNFGVGDGSAVAAAHVTGLAALILAHHPSFQARGVSQTRNPQRVERLLQVLRQSAKPLPIGDVSRTGVGLPDALRAFAQETLLPLQAAFGAVVSPFGAIPGVGTIPGAAAMARPGTIPFPVMPSTAWPFTVPARPAAAAASREPGRRGML